VKSRVGKKCEALEDSALSNCSAWWIKSSRSAASLPKKLLMQSASRYSCFPDDCFQLATVGV